LGNVLESRHLLGDSYLYLMLLDVYDCLLGYQ